MGFQETCVITNILGKVDYGLDFFWSKILILIISFFIQVPPGLYILKRKSQTDIVNEVMAGIIELWPLLVILFVFALLAGFVVWLSEMRTNTGEFPHSFAGIIFRNDLCGVPTPSSNLWPLWGGNNAYLTFNLYYFAPFLLSFFRCSSPVSSSVVDLVFLHMVGLVVSFLVLLFRPLYPLNQ